MAKSTPAQRFARIFELFLNGATPGERDAAERKVNAWLKQHGKTRAPSSTAACARIALMSARFLPCCLSQALTLRSAASRSPGVAPLRNSSKMRANRCAGVLFAIALRRRLHLRDQAAFENLVLQRQLALKHAKDGIETV